MVIAPRPFGQVLSDAMNSLARIWKTLLTPALVVFIPVSLLTVLVFRMTGGSEFLDVVLNRPELLRNLSGEVLLAMARPFYIAISITTLLQLVAGVFVALVSHRTIASDLHGTILSRGEATRAALLRYPAGLVATMLIVVVVGVLLGLGSWLWLVPVTSVGTPNGASTLVALVLLVVLLGPGVWAGVSASMTTSAVIIEDLGALASIRRSMRLVRGRWWPTLGFLLLVGLLGGIAIQMIQLIALPLATIGGAGLALTIASVLGVLTQGLLVAGISGLYTHWYVDLRARDEALSTSDLA